VKKKDMIARMKQLAHNQKTISKLFSEKEEKSRAEIAKSKQIMYENFAELLEVWLD